MPANDSTLGDRIFHLRTAAGYRSQKALADVLGVHAPNVSRWESGVAVPSDEHLALIADHFGVTVRYLLRGGRSKRAA